MSGCPYCGHGEFVISLSLTGGSPGGAQIKCGKCGRTITPDQIRDPEPEPAPAPAAVTPVTPREPVPERERSEVLLALATPDIYRRNPFRVTGLRVTATQREMARQADKLKMFEKLGTAPPPASLALPLDPAPDTEAIREAMQRLQDPEKRLIDEIFWVWPLAGVATDAALEAFETGDAKKAEELWKNEDDGPNRDIGRHNLAVLQHARLLESESDSEREWKEVLARWRKIVNEEAFWSRIAARIREIDDPRLTTGTARRLRLTLPYALLSFNARIAVQAAERGDFDRAKRQRDIVLASGFPQEDIDEALSAAVGSVRERLQTFCKAADKDSDADPAHANKVVTRLIKQTHPLREVITTVLPSSNPTRIGALDEVALKALGAQIVYGNKTDQWAVCADLLPQILEIAVSESARSRIQEQLDRVLHNKAATTCWFCGTGKGQTEQNVEVKMHGNVQHTPTWEGTRVTWNHITISVPRCAECKTKHAASWTAVFGCLGGLLGVGGCVAMAANDLNPLPAVLVIVLSIIGGVIWDKKTLAGAKAESAKTEFPDIVEKVKQGWSFGEAPPTS